MKLMRGKGIRLAENSLKSTWRAPPNRIEAVIEDTVWAIMRLMFV